MRGNRYQDIGSHAGVRSIPACAGQPEGGRFRQNGDAVYPRVCGATADSRAHAYADAGLSPRVRGNRPTQLAYLLLERSIPACAGQPRHPFISILLLSVYPRVCGATEFDKRMMSSVFGLSPRVRGNHEISDRRKHPDRSIPACAGQPSRSSLGGTRSRVYPRVCGATQTERDFVILSAGLSPRVRGNPRRLGRSAA